MTQNDKRRRRDAARKAEALAAKHEQDCRDAARRGEVNGRAEGFQSGAKFACSLVLDAAGRLFKEGKDSDANAVREVHRAIAGDAKNTEHRA